MVQKLEIIKGGGGSVRVGTTGTIGSLMTRELDSMKCTPQSPISSRRKPPKVPVSVPCGVTTTKRLQGRGTTSNEANGSGSNTTTNIASAQKSRRNIQKNTHRIPMLGSDDAIMDTTPNREKATKKGSNIVEVVDLKCGNSDKWSSPIANRLKKFSFSKLSETVG